MAVAKPHHIVMCISNNIQQDQTSCWGFSVLIHGLPPEITLEDLIEMGSCVGPVVEVRLFNADRKAHIKFTKVKDAIKFMELGNREPINTENEHGSYMPLMSPSSDYPFLKLKGLPKKITKDFLIESMKRQVPDFNIVCVRQLFSHQAILQFASQRTAEKMLSHCRKLPLYIGGKKITIEWEGTPAVRVQIPLGFKNKSMLREAFNVIEGDHVMDVALLNDRAYVYFDFRFNQDEAVAKLGGTVSIQMDNGTVENFPYAPF